MYTCLAFTDDRDEVRTAYKKESLRTHPDRLPGGATQQDKRRATEKFVRNPLQINAYRVASGCRRILRLVGSSKTSRIRHSL